MLDEYEGLMSGGDGRPSLAELVDFYRPKWQKDALCREHSEVEFFPSRGGSTMRAKAVCAECLVRLECLRYAIEHEAVGVWAGTSEQDRRRAVRQGLDAVALLTTEVVTASATTCSECSKAGQRLRRGLCDACYQRSRKRDAA